MWKSNIRKSLPSRHTCLLTDGHEHLPREGVNERAPLPGVLVGLPDEHRGELVEEWVREVHHALSVRVYRQRRCRHVHLLTSYKERNKHRLSCNCQVHVCICVNFKLIEMVIDFCSIMCIFHVTSIFLTITNYLVITYLYKCFAFGQPLLGYCIHHAIPHGNWLITSMQCFT